MKNLIKKIKEKTWKQMWAGDWNMLNASDWGEYYLTLKIGGDSFLNKVIFLIKNGKMSAWADERDVKRFSQRMAKRYSYDVEKIKKLSNDLKKKTDITLQYVKDNKNNISSEVYWQHLNNVKQYYLPHVIVKYMIDSIQDELLDDLLPILEDARLYAEPVFTETISFDKFLSKNIAKNIKIKDPLSFLYMTKQELKKYFECQKIISEHELLERRSLSALVFFQLKPKLFTGKDVCLIEKALIFSMDLENIKGNSAYGGKVIGIAKIVKDPKKNKNFNKGDVLITGMTRPEFLPLIKIAAAFVTEAGGILSHAAITARELKIPCIIGTKIATQVLKDGDLVEVDADKGVVKILKKYNNKKYGEDS